MEQKLTDAASKLPETTLTYQKICDSVVPAKKKTTFTSAKRWLTAACFVLLLGIGFGTYAYAAELREYNAAVQFFDENRLSTEGLTRSEIKAVYRDITTASFTYGKTAEVILSSDMVGGFEIEQKIPTREELEAIWNNRNQRPGFRYDILGDDNGNYYFRQFDGETLVWSFECTGFSYPSYLLTDDGIILYGTNLHLYYARIMMLDYDGNLLWKDQPDNGFYYENIAVVLENDDGSYAVISNANTKGFKEHYICLSQYTKDGQRTMYQSTLMSGSVVNATRLGEGYLLQLGNGSIMKMDRSGALSTSFSYSSDSVIYRIQDLIEFNGKIYLSAYATPKLAPDEPTYGNRVEIARILDYAFSKMVHEIPDEEMTPVVQNNYTAVLLVCDPDSGTPKEFYSVEGSLGGELSVSQENLLWDVESIVSARFSPATSAYTVVGSCSVFRYTFLPSGQLTHQEQTDEVTTFYR